MDEAVEHVIVEGEAPDPPEAGATEAVVAAETAIALAGATAAAAELDAAERLRRLEQEGEEWRAGQETAVQELRHSLTALREVELSELNAQRLALAENLSMMAARQEAMEAQFQSLTRPESATETVAEAEGESPTLGAATEIEAGPVSLGGSLGAEVESESSPSRSAHPIRRRRWI
jgi:hypothetical protein